MAVCSDGPIHGGSINCEAYDGNIDGFLSSDDGAYIDGGDVILVMREGRRRLNFEKNPVKRRLKKKKKKHDAH
ncbi:hypothetical protein M5689_006669 [Euphorbia peplus]|nr:hypothetical protein M5689_006669 [Euphorbia peplus]